MGLRAIIWDQMIRAKAHSSQLLESSRPSLAAQEAATPIRPTYAARTSGDGGNLATSCIPKTLGITTI